MNEEIGKIASMEVLLEAMENSKDVEINVTVYLN